MRIRILHFVLPNFNFVISGLRDDVLFSERQNFLRDLASTLNLYKADPWAWVRIALAAVQSKLLVFCKHAARKKSSNTVCEVWALQCLFNSITLNFLHSRASFSFKYEKLTDYCYDRRGTCSPLETVRGACSCGTLPAPSVCAPWPATPTGRRRQFA